jgi:hypothetical protein
MSTMQSRPSSSAFHSPSGSVTPPGNLHPMPMIAIGSRCGYGCAMDDSFIWDVTVYSDSSVEFNGR